MGFAGQAVLAEARRRRVVLRFDGFEMDAARFELRRHGEAVPLPPQPYDLLWLLAAGRGQIVTRDEIRQALWEDGTYVAFDGCVNFAVRELRKVLGDDARQPRFIQALRGRGYRFVAAVEVVEPETAGPSAR